MQQYPPSHDYYAGLAGYRHDPIHEPLNDSRDLDSITDRSKDMNLNSHCYPTSGRHHGLPATSSYTDDVEQDHFSKPSRHDGVQATSHYADNASSGYNSTQSRYRSKRRATNYMDNVGSYYHSTHGENHGKPDKFDYTDDKPVPHPEPRHKEKIGKKELKEQLFQQALQPFNQHSGTLYPCSQVEIDSHRENVFPNRNNGPFVTSREATKEVMWQNDTKRITPILFETGAIKRLLWAASCAQGGLILGPDVVIKAFADLDLVFFGGRLRNHVTVQWRADIHAPGRVWGTCERPRRGEEGQCRIKLNASMIFKEAWTQRTRNPFESMMGTLLHEMCHAYEGVRSPHDIEPGNDGHGKLFATRIAVVHKRALQILGLWAIERGEPYKQYHFFMPGCLEGSEGYKGSSQVDGGRKNVTGKEENNGKPGSSGKRRDAQKNGSGKKAGGKPGAGGMKPKRQHKGSDCVIM